MADEIDTQNLPHLKDVQGQGEKSEIDPNSAAALDKLLLDATGKTGDESGEIKAAPTAPTAEQEAAAKEAAEKEAAEKASKDEPSAEEAEAAKVAAEKAAAEKAAAAAPKAKADDLDSVELPPYTKPKTGEAFAQVKIIARERISTLEKERDELRAKAAELEGKVKEGLPPETKKELEELRAFRQKMDVEADPSFKEFDSRATKNEEAIYAKLKESGIGDDAIKKIKEIGGPAQVDWDPVLSKLPSQVRRYIENKLVENEDLSEKKRSAVDAAKANAAQYLETRSKETESQKTARLTETEKHVNDMVPKMAWFADIKVAANAKPEEKAAAESHNKLIGEIREELKDAITNDSPETKAILTIAYAQLRKLRVDHAALETRHTTEVKALTKERDELKSKLEGIKKSGTPRIRSGSAEAPAGGGNPSESIGKQLKKDPGQHLDDLLKASLAAAQ